MEIIRPGTKIPFTRYRYIAVALSTVLNVAVLLYLFVRGPDLGVDFAGGTMVHVRFQQDVTIPQIRDALARVGLGDSVIQDFGEAGAHEYLIRLERETPQAGALGERIRDGLAQQFGADRFEVRRIETVGPKVGTDLRRRGTLSVIFSTIMMGIYIWIRFGTSFGSRMGLLFGLGAVISLIHDVLISVGALLLARYEFDLTIIAALLTIVGFSVNDTVVICDRIRENLRKSRREKLETIVNNSINECLSRTILTTGTALLVLLALFVLGGAVIRPFAFTLLVGFTSGVYSTIFIASPIILLWERGARR
ncbi:MAG TPA: protein translocase subunit SecF [Candidatus Acidoferrales bacterium]|nr:protein translocase subunit SecF [Candidatus Acidoferrales bacterium]